MGNITLLGMIRSMFLGQTHFTNNLQFNQMCSNVECKSIVYTRKIDPYIEYPIIIKVYELFFPGQNRTK